MRILTICGDHGVPVFGRKGASTHLREMIAALRRAGHDVALAAADLSGDRREDEDFRTFKLPRPTAKILGFDGRYIIADRFSDSVLREAAARFRPDAIYERSALYFQAGARMARAWKLPRILEVNTLLAEEMSTRLKFPRLAAKTEDRLLREAPGIAAISGVMARRLTEEKGVAADRIKVLTMAVDPQRFQNRGRRGVLRAKLGVEFDTPLIGYIGSMNHYHQPARFLELAQGAREAERPAMFAMVGGSGAKVERYREEAAAFTGATRFHVEGPVPQEDLRDWIEALDLVVIPGAAPQSTPTKIFEVAAIGTPMLLPETEPIRELCAGAAEACVVGESELPAALERWFADRACLAEPARRLGERVRADYTWDHHARVVGDWFAAMKAGES
ncbi:MAG: glycosyltransferase family 4 protein [Sumerlaeia bacterium]